MSSLFDDSFLADLEPTDEGPPPPPEDESGPAQEEIPADLFGGRFDVPGGIPHAVGPGRDPYYRDGAPAPRWTPPPSWRG